MHLLYSVSSHSTCPHTMYTIATKHANSFDVHESLLTRTCQSYVHNTDTLLYCVSPRQYLEEYSTIYSTFLKIAQGIYTRMTRSSNLLQKHTLLDRTQQPIMSSHRRALTSFSERKTHCQDKLRQQDQIYTPSAPHHLLSATVG